MENPKPDKIAVVDEVRERLENSSASVVTEYRGLTVAEMADLRRILRAAGGDFKVFKNTLVKIALQGGTHEPIAEFLQGPTAIAFVEGDVSAVAKALKDFAKANPALVIKGGVFDGSALSAKDLSALADLPSRDVLLARLAGLIASPMQTMASLFKAVPQSFAYGLKALIESMPQEAAAPAEAPAPEITEESSADAPAAEDTTEAPAEEEAAAPADEAPVAEEAQAEAPAEDAAPEAAAEDAGADAPADDA